MASGDVVFETNPGTAYNTSNGQVKRESEDESNFTKTTTTVTFNGSPVVGGVHTLDEMALTISHNRAYNGSSAPAPRVLPPFDVNKRYKITVTEV